MKILARQKNDGKRKICEVVEIIKNNCLNYKTDTEGLTGHYAHILRRSCRWFRCASIFSLEFRVLCFPHFSYLSVSLMKNAGRSKRNCLFRLFCKEWEGNEYILNFKHLFRQFFFLRTIAQNVLREKILRSDEIFH